MNTYSQEAMDLVQAHYGAVYVERDELKARVAALEKAICTALDLLPVHLRDAQAALREIVSVPSVCTEKESDGASVSNERHAEEPAVGGDMAGATVREGQADSGSIAGVDGAAADLLVANRRGRRVHAIRTEGGSVTCAFCETTSKVAQALVQRVMVKHADVAICDGCIDLAAEVVGEHRRGFEQRPSDAQAEAIVDELVAKRHAELKTRPMQRTGHPEPECRCSHRFGHFSHCPAAQRTPEACSACGLHGTALEATLRITDEHRCSVTGGDHVLGPRPTQAVADGWLECTRCGRQRHKDTPLPEHPADRDEALVNCRVPGLLCQWRPCPTKPVPGRDDFEAKAAEWLKRGNCTKQDCARCISALAAMLRDVYSEGLRDGPRLDADAQRPDYPRSEVEKKDIDAGIEAVRRLVCRARGTVSPQDAEHRISDDVDLVADLFAELQRLTDRLGPAPHRSETPRLTGAVAGQCLCSHTSQDHEHGLYACEVEYGAGMHCRCKGFEQAPLTGSEDR